MHKKDGELNLDCRPEEITARGLNTGRTQQARAKNRHQHQPHNVTSQGSQANITRITFNSISTAYK